MAADARSVWVKVEYRRPFSGGSIGGGVTARRGPQKTRRGPKVQRGPNLQTREGSVKVTRTKSSAHVSDTADCAK